MALDKAYQTPPFSNSCFLWARKTSRVYKDYKTWKKTLKLDLGALSLLPFIHSENGSSINISLARRNVLNAQALQYILNSVSKNIAISLQNVKTAFEAIMILEKTYWPSRLHDLVDLFNKYVNLKFRPGFNTVRFVADFDQCIDEYKVQGTTFPEDYLASVFIAKNSRYSWLSYTLLCVLQRYVFDWAWKNKRKNMSRDYPYN